MESHLEAPPFQGPPAPDGLRDLVDRIAAELSVAMCRAEVIRAGCAAVLERLGPAPSEADLTELEPLAGPLRRRPGEDVAPVAELIESAATRASKPWPLLAMLVAARDDALVLRGLRAARRLAVGGATVDIRTAVASVARLVEAGASGPASDAALRALGELARSVVTGRRDPVLALFLEDEDTGVRAIAARILDLDGGPVRGTTSMAVLGAGAWRVLEPYLEYTRATHADLVHAAPRPGRVPAILDALREASEAFGERLLKEIVAAIGWERLSLGLTVRRVAAVRVGSSLPFFVSPEEAALFGRVPTAKRGGEFVLAFGHGGPPSTAVGPGSDDPVVRYRGYNLAHAEALREILDVAPLDASRFHKLVGLMDRIVADHTALFAAHADECAILPGVWAEWKGRAEDEWERNAGSDLLSPELTRLVMTFEDPASLGAVRSLHGLKRYLHQAGLRLGFRLVQAGRATNRTVDVVLASGGRVVGKIDGIRYVDFEPAAAESGAPEPVPYAVRIVAEGFARQMLHGRTSFPSARIFCYGNEVHYYLTYGTHPALVRADFAPPLQGGMVDLEYYGVSRYELEAHPARDLSAVRSFFRRIEFDVQVEPNTRVHARYDKERARDLGDLCEKAEALFRLAPYLMDLDWVLGDLELRPEGRRTAAEAWGERFAAWGGLPLDRMLTRDRRGILAGTAEGPSGEEESRWNGDAPYRDRFEPVAPGALAPLVEQVASLGIEIPTSGPADAVLSGQIGLESALLLPLRSASARGEIVPGGEGPARAPEDLFRRRHETEAFVELLDGDLEMLAASVRMARTVLGLERTLTFRATGSLNGHEVQRARVPLRGDALTLHVLRGPRGMIRLAAFSPRGTLGRSRAHAEAPWRDEGSVDVAALATVLRASGYEPSPCDLAMGESRAEAERLRETLRRPNPQARPRLLPGERIADGIPASPGRAVGRAVLGVERRSPEDFDGKVLVSATLRPEDGPILSRAAGVVSTGGGILSHAGLIAAQYRKPALIVTGAWGAEGSRPGQILVRIAEYREDDVKIGDWPATVRRDAVEREYPVRDGDLVVVDADRGALEVLGQHPHVLALHDGLRSLGSAARRLDRSEDPAELLTLRGERLRSRHRAGTVLERLADPVVSRFAVREILLGNDLAGTSGGTGERRNLLAILLANHEAGNAAREHLARIHGEMSHLRREAMEEAAQRIPEARTLHEILALRLHAVRLVEIWKEAAEALAGSGATAWTADDLGMEALDRCAAKRIADLRDGVLRELPDLASADDPRLRHALRALSRLDAILEEPPGKVAAKLRRRLREQDARAVVSSDARRVLPSREAGLELAPLIGFKAANLAEVARLAGAERVPPWFAVTDAAFREVLRSRVASDAGTGESVVLGDAIARVLARGDLDLAARAAAIRDLFERVALPDALRAEIEEAYDALRSPGQDEPFVAVRSSARGEDTETTARAGEFDTFLFVRGAASVVAHVQRAWAGFWNARALYARGGGPAEAAGGGIVVQRMINSRVSGVVQTIHAAAGDPGEIVINAGLGLGEGIVSGAVGADQITVSKEGDLTRGPLQFHYVVGDKSEQVVFDPTKGSGTLLLESRYHQRYRPALEYVELLDIVGTASRLEAAYGYPLDIEFALEGDRIWVLQARPVPEHAALVRETLERYPLAGAHARLVREEEAT